MGKLLALTRISLSLLLLIPSLVLAQPAGKGIVSVADEDLSPEVFPWQLRFANGAVTDNGDGTASVAAGAGGITGSGTTNYLAKWTSASALGNSIISDNGTIATVIGGLYAGPTSINATGGTITYAGGYTIHTFTSDGTFTPGNAGNVEYLVVGGGGSGGSGAAAGGGGAGGFRTASGFAVTAQAYSITVGDGGVAGSGEDSVFSTITSTGGGKGANEGGTGSNGGSGGGGAYTGGAVGAGTVGQGNDGGLGGGSAAGGGGGGASAVGAANSGNNGGAGGAGTASSISGASVTYAGGGGGAASGTAGAGGAGGGGAGAKASVSAGVNGTANTGGGGGGAYDGQAAGNGGSGIVIIRYPTVSYLSVSSSTGNVRIGNTNDTYALDVTGDVYMSGDLRVIGDDIFATTNTDRFVFMGDGTNYNPEAINLGTDTVGNYAAGDAEAGAATSGDSATAFFSSGTIEGARLGEVSRCFPITGATTASDFGSVARMDVAVTLNSIHCLAVGGTNVVGQLQECDANGLNCADVDSDMTCTADTNVNDDGSLTNPSIDAGDYLGVKTTSVSGTNTRITWCYEYTVN